MKWDIILGAAALLGGAAAYGTYRYWHPCPPKERKGKKHIVCIGDSITYGAGVIPLNLWKSYPAYLQKLLRKEYQVLNFGLSGRTLMSTGDMPYQKEAFYSAALEVQNPHYILMLGSNDARVKWWDANRFREELIALLADLKEKGTVTVMLPPKAFPVEQKGEISFGIRDNLICQVGTIISEVAQSFDIPVINLYALTEHHPEWFPDGVHPNAEGNQQIAKYIYRALWEDGNVLYRH